MDFRYHYNMLNSLHEAAPHLIKKTSYEICFTVAPSLFRPNIELYVDATPLADDFKRLKKVYGGEKFYADVEEFYVSSSLGNNIFLASFSSEGVSEEAANSVLRKSSFDLTVSRYQEARSSSFNIGEHFWANTHRWNAHKDETDDGVRNQLMENVLQWMQENPDNVFPAELLTFLSDSHADMVKVFPSRNIFDLFSLFEKKVVDVEFMRNVVQKFWLWNDEYFYTEFAEPYRFLQHPDWNTNNSFHDALKFNMDANSLGKNITTAIFVPHVETIGEQFGVTNVCSHCFQNGAKHFVKTGNNVKTVESLCDSCVVFSHELRKKMISFTGDNYHNKTSIYSLMLADSEYNVLTEAQLVSLILDFPEFKNEILSSSNATDKVKTAAALTVKSSGKYF